MEGKVKKISKKTTIIAVIAILLILVCASSFCFWKYGNNIKLLGMISANTEISIELPELAEEQGTKIEYQWTELGYLNTYAELRKDFDDVLEVTKQGSNGKNGVIYADLNGEWTNNSTLYYAFNNKKFVDDYWKKSETLNKMIASAKENYVDVESDKDAMYAGVNAYWNIIEDNEPSYFNGGCAVTRAEFLASVFRAEQPVQILEADEDFINVVDLEKSNLNTIYASQLKDCSYLKIDNCSLNEKTYEGSITVAEAVYTMAKKYYSDEFNGLNGKETVTYTDCKNGGDLIGKLKYKDGKTSESGEVKYWESYELSYAVQNPNKGLPEDLYKAMVIASNHKLLTSEDISNWSSALSKRGLIELIVNVYVDCGTKTNVERGSASGTIIEDDAEELAVVGTALDKVVTTHPWDELKLVYEDNKIVIDDETLGILYGFEFFDGASQSQMEDYFNEEEQAQFYSTAEPEMSYYLLTGEIDFGGKLIDRLKEKDNSSKEQGSQGGSQSGESTAPSGETGGNDDDNWDDLKNDPLLQGGTVGGADDGPPASGELPDGMIIIGH